MLIPEQIWHSLEQNRYLSSAKLFLIAEYLYTELKTTKGTVGNLVNTKFPVYKRQWETIKPLKQQIMEHVVKELQNVILDDMVTIID